MAAFTGKTLELATKSKVATFPKFVEWFIDNGLPDYSDVAVSGTSEDGFEKSILDIMVGEGVDEAKKAGNKVALKKFWIACRGQHNTDRTPRSEASALMDDPIPKPEEKIIGGLWYGRQDFELPDSQLLIPSIQGRMWRGFNATPPQLSVLLPEQLRQ